MCSECGLPVLARGLCRKHYDRTRKIPRFAISKTIQAEVEALAKEKGWTLAQTINQLMEFGLKWVRKKEQIEKEYA